MTRSPHPDRLRRTSRRAGALVAATALMTACAAGEDPPSDDPAGDEAASPGAEDAATDDAPMGDAEPLTLLTHESFDLSEDVLAGFTDRTGIAVDVVPVGDAGAALNQAILTRDDPQGDLLFGVDTTFLSRAIEAEVFTPYVSGEVDRIDPAMRPDTDLVTPIDVGDVCLNIDVAAFEGAEAPTSLEELTDPAFAGQTVVLNPATSSPGLAFLLATVDTFGEDGYLDFWADLRDNDVLVSDGWSSGYYDEFSGSGQGGERPIVVSYASSPAAEVLFADPPTDTAPTANVAASCIRQVEHIGILAGSDREDDAGAFIDFLLSVEVQEDIPLVMFVEPVVTDAELPEVFLEHADRDVDPITLDPLDIDDADRDRWIADWTDTVLR